MTMKTPLPGELREMKVAVPERPSYGPAVATTGTPAQPGEKKGCKAAKAKASQGAKGAAAEPHGKACKPRKAKSRGHKPS